MIWLDLEGTVIDDLESRNWLDKNLSIIQGLLAYYEPFSLDKNVIKESRKFGVYTWGWFDEIDNDGFIALLENKLGNGYKCVEVINKQKSMELMRKVGKWNWKGTLDINAELNFNDHGFSKETVFSAIMEDRHSFDTFATEWLFDDTIKSGYSISLTKSHNHWEFIALDEYLPNNQG